MLHTLAGGNDRGIANGILHSRLEHFITFFG
jgi:hypothetical protein